MVHCKSYIVHRKSMIRVWFPWKSEMVMKITINLSFMYFALHLGGTIRHIISNFKDQDGSGFGQMPNLQYQWSWRDSCCHWRWCGSVKTASPLVISLISQENFLAWASPALGLLAGAKHLVSGKEKKKEREKKKELSREMRNSSPPIEAVYLVVESGNGPAWFSPFLFCFGCFVIIFPFVAVEILSKCRSVYNPHKRNE